MSFLNQLKQQAEELRTQQQVKTQSVEEITQSTEAICREINRYLMELAPQLNTIQPPAPPLSLDGKTRWPAMKLSAFRADQRKKMLRGKEAFDYLAMGWDIAPAIGGKLTGMVSVNFPPDLERVTKSLTHGNIQFERKDIRDPVKNSLRAIEFHYDCRARGSVSIAPDHDQGMLVFRLTNVTGFEVRTVKHAAHGFTTSLLDEMAKLLVGQPNRFLPELP
jgi:hypothetical protein